MLQGENKKKRKKEVKKERKTKKKRRGESGEEIYRKYRGATASFTVPGRKERKRNRVR